MSTNYQLGQLIRLKGLNNTIYNGKLAKIKLFASSELCCNGRYRVKLMGEAVPSVQQVIDVKPENMEHACQCCHKSGENLMFCGNCKNARYCDRECQRIDWERHKEVCKMCSHARYATKNLLIPAIFSANFELVRKLVEEGMDVNMSHSATSTAAIHFAAAIGHFPIVQYLLQHGADMDHVDNEGISPLWNAAKNGHLAVLQHLLELGADKDNANNNGTSPLYVAAQNGHLPVVKYLLDQGADKDKANNEGATPLIITIQQGHLPIVKCLVEHLVDKDKAMNGGMTPLHIAAHIGSTEVLSCLMSSGASLTGRDRYGQLPIDVAANETIKQLIRDEEKRRRTQVSTEPK